GWRAGRPGASGGPIVGRGESVSANRLESRTAVESEAARLSRLSARPRAQVRPALRDAILGVGVFVFLLLAWEAFVRLRGLSALVLPPPGAVARTLVEQLSSGQIWPHLATTLTEVLLGFALGTVLGLGGGAMVAHAHLL